MIINTYLPYSIPDEDLNLYIRLKELGYDLYNPNDSFYRDICTPYTTDNKKDVLLSDRRFNYLKNISFCEEGCIYKTYDYINKRVQCECKIVNEIDNNIDNIKFYSNLLLSNFFEIEKFSNIKVIKCFKLIFTKLGQIVNIGSYIFIILILIHIILLILFLQKGKKQLLNIITIALRNNNIQNPIRKKIRNKSEKKNHINNNKIIINKKIIINNHYINIKKQKTNRYMIDKSNNVLNINNSSKKNISSSSASDKNIKKKNTKNNKNSKFFNNREYKLEGKKLDKIYHDIELNSLTYNEAIKYDKRTFFQYYCSLLRQKHLILFTFFSKNDYNLFINKLSFFIFSFSLYFAVNTLFFDDNTIHNLYESEGKLQFIYSILNIIYSTAISSIILFILKFFILSNKRIFELKSFKKELLEFTNIVRNLYIKFIFYFIISLIFLIFFWYYVSIFCAVYKNSQILLIENTICSFIMSLIYPFGLNLLPGMFRIYALRSKNKKCLYYFGNIITII